MRMRRRRRRRRRNLSLNESFELHCDGVKTGHGKVIFKNDDETDMFEGTFENGNPVRGTMTMQNGIIQSGVFNKQFELHGDDCVENDSNGNMEVAKYESNRPTGLVVTLTSDRCTCSTGISRHAPEMITK